MVFRVAARRTLILTLTAYLFATSLARARQTERHRAAAGKASAGVYLVFPFENAGSAAHLDWLGEGLEELIISRLSAAEEQVYSHSGRLSELERYGLPASAKLSHAAMLRMAQDLDADYVVFGRFNSDGTKLTVEARMLAVSPTALVPEVRETGPLSSLMDITTQLVWKSLLAKDRTYPVSLADFRKRQQPLRLDAFEHYIRGLLATEDEAKLRELREAARLEPEWADPDFALGQVYFARNDCNSALPWFARVPNRHDRNVEAVFSSGVCRLLLGQSDRAEETFVSLQSSLEKAGVPNGDFPEILNDLALARARQGKLPAAQGDLRRAMELGPDEDDYPFNLGLLALRANDTTAAAGYFREAAEREPNNPEDRALMILSLEKAGKKEEAEQERAAAAEAFGPNGLPVVRLDPKNSDSLARWERVKNELDAAELRPELRPADRAMATNGTRSADATSSPLAHVRRGRQALSANQLDAAASEFRAALAMDPTNASAHSGLAEIARKQGRLEEAIRELQASLVARDSAATRTSLARIYLEQKKPGLARVEVEKALKLAPNYAEAKQLLEHLGKQPDSKPKGGVR